MSRGEMPIVVSRVSCVALAVVVTAGLLQLGLRLKRVQVDGAADYSYASARQSVRRVQVGGLRGRILDRHGAVLAENRLSLSIVCLPAHFQKRTWEGTVAELTNAIAAVVARIGRPSPLTERAVRRHVNQSLAMPLPVWRDIDERELAVFSEHEREFPGFAVEEAEANGLFCLASDKSPTDANVEGRVLNLPLDTELWTAAILSANPERRNDAVEALRAMGYDIRDFACRMEREYTEAYERGTR